MADIFICHSKQDADLTIALARVLERQGYTTWWDTSLLAGERSREPLVDEIDKAKAVVVIWTPASIKSKWVLEEAEWAAGQGKLITVRSEDLKPYEIPLPFDINRRTVLVTEYEKIFEALLYFTTLQPLHQTSSSVPDEQEPGIQFVPQEDGKIHLTPSGFASADEVTEILAMRGVIIEALDDLAVLLDGSNAYASIATVAQRFKTAISAVELSVDLL